MSLPSLLHQRCTSIIGTFLLLLTKATVQVKSQDGFGSNFAFGSVSAGAELKDATVFHPNSYPTIWKNADLSR